MRILRRWRALRPDQEQVSEILNKGIAVGTLPATGAVAPGPTEGRHLD